MLETTRVLPQKIFFAKYSTILVEDDKFVVYVF